MLGRLLGIFRADIDQQIGWVRSELRLQTRHTTLKGVLWAAATAAALGVIVVGLIALHTMQYGPFVAHGLIGGGLLVLTLSLVMIALVQQRPKLGSRPALRSAQPATLLGVLTPQGYGRAIAAGDQALRVAVDTMRNSSLPAVFGMLAIAAAVGLIMGRGLYRGTNRTPEATP